eukprot:922563-Pyramimonas_sp.AAC.1
MGTTPNNTYWPKPTAATVGQAASCLKWAQAAATPTTSPAQNEQGLLLGIALILSVPSSRVQKPGIGGLEIGTNTITG